MVDKNNIRLTSYTIFLLLLIIISSLLFNVYIKQDLEDMVSETLAALSIQFKASIDKELENQRNNVASIGEVISVFDISEDKDIALYINNIRDNFGFENFIVTDINGKGILATGDVADISHTKSFQVSIKGNICTSEPIISQFSKEPVIAVSAPVYYDYRLSGVVVAEYNIDYIEEFLNEAIRYVGYVLIIDDEGKILIRSSDIFNEYEHIDEFSYETQQTYDEFMDDILNKTAYVVDFSTEDMSFSAAYEPLKFNNWSLVYILPSTVVEQNSQSITEKLFILNIMIVLALAALVAYVVHSKQQHMKSIEKIAFYDELTGLPNIAKFKLDISKILNENNGKQYYVVKGDIENFKAINDMYDHKVGDEVLKTIAKVGLELDEPSFLMARVGGDEFLMFAERHFFEDMNLTSTMYETAFQSKLEYAKNHQFIFRLGRYLIEENETDVNEIISKTNYAHRQTKLANSSRIGYYNDDIKRKLLKRTEIANKMENALANNEFKVFLQPKNSVETNRVIGAEALVRWIEQDGGMIYPNDFIPLFERNGFIEKVDKYIFESVCKTIRSWIDDNKPCVPISVNFSRKHISNSNFVTELVDIVKKYKLSTEYIEIEMTETISLEDETELKRVFDELKAENFLISIDDFGSGYSSLGMLKNFDADTLKLDRKFFTDETDEHRQYCVIDGIIKIAHSLEMYVVAEGIEEASQIDYLKQVNCDAAQGYFYAKPMPVSNFEQYLLENL